MMTERILTLVYREQILEVVYWLEQIASLRICSFSEQ
jgi:hypothetical protein